jgi:hypothetical protein
MSIHVRRTGSTRSWVLILAVALFVIVGLATATFGLAP